MSLRDKGVGILLISSDLDEILALSDRIVVILEGRIRTEMSRAVVDITQLGLWMTGGASA